MNRKLIRLILFLAILLVLGPFKTSAIQNEIKEKVVGNLPEANVKLYAVERGDYLEKFRLDEGGRSKDFPLWRNVNNSSYYPKLIYKDINRDGQKDLIIILTLGYGTGVMEQEVHMLHKTKTNIGEVYREIIVDNPRAILLKTVKTKLTQSEAIVSIGNEKTIIKINKFGIDPKLLFSDIVTANMLKFDVIDNKLTAIIGAQISPTGGYIGDFRITFTFKDKMYQGQRIKFIPI